MGWTLSWDGLDPELGWVGVCKDEFPLHHPSLLETSIFLGGFSEM